MTKAEITITSEMIEDVVHRALYQAIRDLFPSGFEHFYSTPPELEQVITDAIRWRYFCMKNAQEWFGRDTATTEDLNVEIDKRINEELDS